MTRREERVESLSELAVGDDVVVDYDRFVSPVETTPDTVTGEVIDLRRTYETIDRAIVLDGDGRELRVRGEGTVDLLRDQPLDKGLGRSADIRVKREVVADGGRVADADDGELQQMDPVDFKEMSADDWEEYLEENPECSLQVTDPKGTHEFRYEPDQDYVTFWAFGTQGYDEEGSRSALEAVAGESKGLVLVGYEEVSEA